MRCCNEPDLCFLGRRGPVTVYECRACGRTVED